MERRRWSPCLKKDDFTPAFFESCCGFRGVEMSPLSLYKWGRGSQSPHASCHLCLAFHRGLLLAFRANRPCLCSSTSCSLRRSRASRTETTVMAPKRDHARAPPSTFLGPYGHDGRHGQRSEDPQNHQPRSGECPPFIRGLSPPRG